MRPTSIPADRHRRPAAIATHLVALALLIVTIAFVCGCIGPIYRYKIVVTPLGDSLDRSIRLEGYRSAPGTSRSASGPRFDIGLEDRLAAAYEMYPAPERWPADTTIASQPFLANARFQDVPDDIGTQGHYRHQASSLGESFFYAERIRGMSDPADWVSRRFTSADTLAGIVADWLRFELVTQPEWSRISADLEPELRAIARTVAATYLLSGGDDSLLSGWLLTLLPEHPLSAVVAAPLLEDSSEVSDLAPYIAPHIARARTELARRMGLRSAADEERVLSFLDDCPTMAAAYRGWIGRAAEARPHLRGAVGRSFQAMIDAPQEHDPDVAIDFELRARSEPFSTNGKWIDSLQCVRWRGECAGLSDQADGIPLACAATWSVPDTTVQRRLFGAVVLEEEALSDYADWFAALPAARQAEWDHMLLALRPGRIGPLTRFRFRDEIPGSDASARARTRITQALTAYAEKQPARKAR